MIHLEFLVSTINFLSAIWNSFRSKNEGINSLDALEYTEYPFSWIKMKCASTASLSWMIRTILFPRDKLWISIGNEMSYRSWNVWECTYPCQPTESPCQRRRTKFPSFLPGSLWLLGLLWDQARRVVAALCTLDKDDLWSLSRKRRTTFDIVRRRLVYSTTASVQKMQI